MTPLTEQDVRRIVREEIAGYDATFVGAIGVHKTSLRDEANSVVLGLSEAVAALKASDDAAQLDGVAQQSHVLPFKHGDPSLDGAVASGELLTRCLDSGCKLLGSDDGLALHDSPSTGDTSVEEPRS